MKMSPCKNCMNRKMGCHDTCDMYINWSNKCNLIKKIINNEKEMIDIVNKTKLKNYMKKLKKGR